MLLLFNNAKAMKPALLNNIWNNITFKDRQMQKNSFTVDKQHKKQSILWTFAQGNYQIQWKMPPFSAISNK